MANSIHLMTEELLEIAYHHQQSLPLSNYKDKEFITSQWPNFPRVHEVNQMNQERFKREMLRAFIANL